MIWYEADYFKDFKCKCGECRTSCCDSWEIALSEAEFHRLNNAACSDRLFRQLQCAFREVDNPTPKRYRLFARNFIGRCPMHDESGLCGLQLELGEPILPEICRVYPRSMHMKGEKCRAVCTAGCEGVVEILLKKDRVDFILTEDDLPVDLNAEAGENFHQLFRQILDTAHDRTLPFKDRLTCICRAVQPSFQPVNDPAAGFTTLMDAVRALKDYSPTLSELSSRIEKRYINIEVFLQDRSDFDQTFGDGEQWFENLFVNHLIYADFPETDPRVSCADSVYGLCLAYALIRLICILTFRDGESAMVDSIAAAFRYIEHTAFYYNARVTVNSASALPSV